MISNNRKPIELKKSNPRLLNKNDLISQFVARQPLLERLLDDLRRASQSGGIQHHLLIGRKGMGKTMLLERLCYAIEDNIELAKHWIPLSFREEQSNIQSLSDLWSNCLDSLAEVFERKKEKAKAEQLDDEIARLPKDDEQHRSELGLMALMRWAESENKGFVLLMDNVDEILKKLSKQQWGFRDTLSHNKRFIFIGAAPQQTPYTQGYDAAFFDFFQPHTLAELSQEETRSLMLTLAELYYAPHVARVVESEPGRIEALRTFTGGNPRALVTLFLVMAREQESGNIINQLETVLDDTTEYYKELFKNLSYQRQLIVDAMCLRWNPVTAAELADALRMETNIVSAQLDHLVKEAIIEKVITPSGDKQRYQVADRLFNVWFLMRNTRRLRYKLIWTINFLKVCYNSDQLRDKAKAFIKKSLPELEAHFNISFVYAQDDLSIRRAVKLKFKESAVMREIDSSLLEHRKSPLYPNDNAPEVDDDDPEEEMVLNRQKVMEEIKKYISDNVNANWDALTKEECSLTLSGSWVINLDEKRTLAERFSKLFEREIIIELDKIKCKQRHLAELLDDEAAGQLMEAISNGVMADVTHVEGAETAAALYDAPLLKVIARVERFRKMEEKEAKHEIDDILKTISEAPECGYVNFGMGMVLTTKEDRRSEAETFLRRVLVSHPNSPPVWNIWGNFLYYYPERLGESEAAYRKAVELDPSYRAPYRNLGLLLGYQLKQRSDEAATAYRKALELDPYKASDWLELGLLYQHGLKQIDEAEKAYRKAIELEPKPAAAWSNLGNLLAGSAAQHGEVEAALCKAVELEPNSTQYRSDLAEFYCHQLKNYEKAEETYRKAIELHPKASWPWSDLGEFFAYNLKRPDDAEAAYRKAIEIDPNDISVWNRLGIFSLTVSRNEEAEKAFRKIIELEPGNGWAWNNLGNSLAELPGRLEEAEEAYRKAIELEPESALTWHNLGNLLADQLKRYEEAASAFNAAIKLEPNKASYWNSLGLILGDNLELYKEAEDAFLKSVELYPEDPRPWSVLGLLRANRRAYDEAEVAYRKVAELNPKNAWAWNSLGDFFANQVERYDQAEEAYRKAIEVDGTSAQPHNSLGELYHYGLKNFEEAEKYYRKAIELDGKFAAPWFNLGDLLVDLPGRDSEMRLALHKAIEFAYENVGASNDVAWRLFLKDYKLDDAEALAHQAVKLSPDDASYLHTLACILARRGKWEEAHERGKQYIVNGSDEFHARIWPDTVIFFKEAVKTGHAVDAVRLLDEIGYEDRWLPLREALVAIADGNDAPLLRAAPEIRQPAKALVKELLPEGTQLESSLKKSGGKRAKSKKT